LKKLPELKTKFKAKKRKLGEIYFSDEQKKKEITIDDTKLR
jgi:hypothetical protein